MFLKLLSFVGYWSSKRENRLSWMILWQQTRTENKIERKIRLCYCLLMLGSYNLENIVIFPLPYLLHVSLPVATLARLEYMISIHFSNCLIQNRLFLNCLVTSDTLQSLRFFLIHIWLKSIIFSPILPVRWLLQILATNMESFPVTTPSSLFWFTFPTILLSFYSVD